MTGYVKNWWNSLIFLLEKRFYSESARNYNRGNNIMKQLNILYRSDSSQVKRDIISSTINFVYELPQGLQNDLRLDIRKLGNIKQISKLGGDRA